MLEPVFDVAIEAPAQALDRIRGWRPLAVVGMVEFVEAVVDDAVDERRLVAEVVVDRRRRDAGAEADLADRETFLAVRGEELLGRVEDRTARGLGLEIAGAGGGGAGRRHRGFL